MTLNQKHKTHQATAVEGETATRAPKPIGAEGEAPRALPVEGATRTPAIDSADAKLKALKIQLTEPASPEGGYVPCVRTGNLLFISGQLPKIGPQLAFKGRLGKEVSLDNGQRAAKQALANALSVAKWELGSLDKIKKVVRLTGYVNSYPGFTEQAKVMDAASEMLVQIFGEAGKHSRVSVGVTDLPLLATIEIDLILEVK